jgi:hypothetical protein
MRRELTQRSLASLYTRTPTISSLNCARQTWPIAAEPSIGAVQP